MQGSLIINACRVLLGHTSRTIHNRPPIPRTRCAIRSERTGRLPCPAQEAGYWRSCTALQCNTHRQAATANRHQWLLVQHSVDTQADRRAWSTWLCMVQLMHTQRFSTIQSHPLASAATSLLLTVILVAVHSIHCMGPYQLHCMDAWGGNSSQGRQSCLCC